MLSKPQNKMQPQKPQAPFQLKELVSSVKMLDPTSRKAFFKEMEKLYPVEKSTYNHIQSEVKSALSQYQGGFFGISARRYRDIENIRNFCDRGDLSDGRSVTLAYGVYHYAKKQIQTGWLNRSALRDSVLAALKKADIGLYASLEKLELEKPLSQENVRKLAEANPSVRGVRSFTQASQKSDISLASSEDGSPENLEELTESIILGYGRSLGDK